MKYLSLIIILAATIVFANTQLAKTLLPMEHTEIHLQIRGLSSQWIYLQGVHENVKSKVDSSWVDTEGKAFLMYSQPFPPGFYTIKLGAEESIPMLLDKDQVFTLETDFDQLIKNMKVRGSKENSLLYEKLQWDIDLQERFQAEVQQIMAVGEQTLDEAMINQLRQKYFTQSDRFLNELISSHANTLFAKIEKAQQPPESLLALLVDPPQNVAARYQELMDHFWDNVDFSDPRLLQTPVVYEKLWQYMQEFVPNQTNLKIQAVDLLMAKVQNAPEYYRFFARWIAEDYMPPFTAQMDPDAFYVHMVDRYLTEERAFWADSLQIYAWQLRAKDRRLNLLGTTAGDFIATTPDGQSQRLYEVTTPYIALFFYHYDCDHCVEATPKMVAKYEALKEQGLEVVAVAMDTPLATWRAFIKEHNMSWINVTDENNTDIYKKYAVRATPEIILLNPDRTIIGKHLAVDDIPIVIQADRQGISLGVTSSNLLGIGPAIGH